MPEREEPGVRLTPVDYDPFAPPPAAILPLTEAQAEMWAAVQMGDDASCSYNQCFPLRLRGSLDATALGHALQGIVDRHAALRTTFDAEGGQRILGHLEVQLHRIDLAELEPAEGARALQDLLDAESRTPFDLSAGPLLRAVLVREAPEVHALVLTAHHIVCDGWSSGVLLRDLGELYSALVAGAAASLPGAASYEDYVRTSDSAARADERRAAEEFWASRFSDAVPALDLPLDRPRPPIKTYAGAQYDTSLPDELPRQLRKVAASHGCTLYHLLLAAFQALLARLSGQNEMVIGIPVAGQALLQDSSLVGHCVHTLPLRATLDPRRSFGEHLKVTRGLLLSAQEHQGTTFGSLVNRLGIRRDPSRSPLVAVVFNVDRLGPAPVFQGLTAEALPAHKAFVNFELNLNVVDLGAGLRLECSYNTDLFGAATIRRWMDHYRVLLEGVVADAQLPVERLPLLTEEERGRLAGRVASARELSGPCLHERFEEQVARTPEAIAACCGDAALTYAELSRRANALARRLAALGVGPDTLVGLSLERSLDLVVGILGILKAGGAYLPLDPAYPRERLAFMVEDARVPVIVTQRALEASLPAGPAARVLMEELGPGIEENPRSGATASNLAYVIYTSGSTGKPKGCEITHGNVTRLFESTDAWFGFGPQDVWTLFHSYAFDFTVWELWGALLYGGRLVVVPYWVSRSPEAFLDLLGRERVTILNQTPSAFRQLVQAEIASGRDPEALCLRFVVFGGEALDLQSLRPWYARHGDERPRLVNMYGITETTVHVTYRPLTRADVEGGAGSVIGVPIPDLYVRVLDPSGQPVPIGVSGEMYVGGAGVARGYLNRPELTAQRFVADPVTGDPAARMYRSGDLARWLEDGGLEYLGRIDHQVKIRGFRIELGEIESVLSQHPAVREVVVVAREDAPGDRRLVAYVAAAERGPLAEELRARLRAVLPDYMVPSAFVFLDALPLTENGKVDRKALPAPAVLPRSDAHDHVAPRTETERVIAEIWQSVLGLSEVGAFDNFFDLGGDSFLSVKVVREINRRLGKRLGPVDLIRPNLAQLASRCDQADGAEASDTRESGLRTVLRRIIRGA